MTAGIAASTGPMNGTESSSNANRAPRKRERYAHRRKRCQVPKPTATIPTIRPNNHQRST
jgi:hypothetical protein